MKIVDTMLATTEVRTMRGFVRDVQIDGFDVRHAIGNGGMAIVYEAIRHGKMVALKVLTANSDEVLRLRFRLEAELLTSLRHNNLVQGLEYGVYREKAWIAMELLDGAPLQAQIQSPTFTLGARIELFLDVARAVEFLHDHQIVHRDIKPSNIFVVADGSTRLIDLGIAKMGALELTPHGVLTASPYSIAPEEILDCPVDHRVDIFSMGVLLFNLLTGSHPWPKKNLYSAMYARCAHEAPRADETVSTIGPLGLPPEHVARFSPVAQRALAREPNDRYQTMRDLIDDVEALLHA